MIRTTTVLPNQIPNLECWYDPSSTSLQGLSAGTFVNFVQDLSGNNRHLIQDRSTTNQPQLIYNNGDGRVGLYFNGLSPKWLFASGWTTSSVTQFCVFKNESSLFSVMCSSIGNFSSATDFHNIGFYNAGTILTRNSTIINKPVFSGLTLNNTRVYYMQDNSFNNIAMINGLTRSLTKTNFLRIGVCLGGNFDRRNNANTIIGAIQPALGTIYEYVSYDRLLTQEEIRQIERYLIFKWGVNGRI
jgi:hypothetical protein